MAHVGYVRLVLLMGGGRGDGGGGTGGGRPERLTMSGGRPECLTMSEYKTIMRIIIIMSITALQLIY